MEVDEKEAAIRAKYRAINKEKIEKQVQELKAKDEEKRRLQDVEQKKKEEERKKAEDLKAKIARELENIKKMEELRKAKIKAEKQRKALEEACEKVRKEEAEKLALVKEQQRKEEVRRKNEEARLRVQEEIEAMKLSQAEEQKRAIQQAKDFAEESKKRAREEEKKKKQAREAARRKAVEDELKRLEEEEAKKAEAKRAEERRQRQEEAKRIEEEIMQRRKEEQERQRQAREELEEQKRRDQEDLKKRLHEEKMRKFKEAEAKKKLELDREQHIERPNKRRSTGNNPILSKFEELSRMAAAEDSMKKAMVDTFRKRKKPFVLTKAAIKKSTTKLARALSKEMLKNKGSNQGLVRALSKELRKSASKENLKKFSQEKLKRSKGSLSRLRVASRSRSSLHQSGLQRTTSMQRVTFESDSMPTSSKDMQNYLLSQVLFDGKGDVKAKHRMSALAKVNEREEKDLEERRKREEELSFRDKMFQSYKEEMEKYLSVVCEDGPGKHKVKKKKTKRTKDTREKKPIMRIGGIRDKFETGDLGQDESAANKKTGEQHVGKLDKRALAFDSQAQEAGVQKKEYVPVVIDRDAFDRTMNRFELYKQEEEERERRLRDIEDRKRRAREEQIKREREAALRARQCAEDSSDGGNSEAEEENSEEERSHCNDAGEDEAGPEVEQHETEEEKLAKMDISARIQHELQKIKELEEAHRAKIARENKKRELMRQIQEQMELIKGIGKSPRDRDSTPPWIKMVQDAESRQNYLKEKREPKESNSSPDNDSSEACLAETGPKWVQMVLDFKEKKDKNEALVQEDIREPANLRVEEQNASRDTSEGPETANRSMTFEESVEAMLSLIEEEKKVSKRPVKANKKSTPKSFAPLKAVNDVKSLFEQSEPDQSTVSKAAVPQDVNTISIQKAKEHLLQRQSSEMSSRRSDLGRAIKNKCTDIKGIFDRKEAEKNRAPELAPKKKKSIIEVRRELSLDEQLQQQKEKNKDVEWSYQKKDARELQELLEAHSTVKGAESATGRFAQRASKLVADKAKLREAHDTIQTRQREQEEDFGEFMKSVESYVSQPAKSLEESDFQESIKGYLSLIEDRSRQVSANSNLPKLDIPRRDIAKAQDLLLQDSSQASMKPSSAVGKLNMSEVESSLKHSNETRAGNQSATQVTRDGCDSLKRMLLRNEAPEPDTPLKNYTKKRVIHISAELEEPASKKLSEERQYQWKWKQKTIQELQSYIKENNPAMSTLSEVLQNQKVVNRRGGESVEELEKKTQELKRAMAEKDREFHELMNELSTLDSGRSEEDQSQRYLADLIALVGGDSSEPKNDSAQLPELSVPWKLSAIKDKFHSSIEKSEAASRTSNVVGKLNKASWAAAKKKDDDIKSEQIPDASLSTDKLKRMFEENSRMATGRTSSALDLSGPRKLKKKSSFLNIQSQLPDLSLFKRKQKLSSIGVRSSQERSNGYSLQSSIPHKTSVRKSVWDSIDDPEERKRAILAKHGFKPANERSRNMSTDINDDDLETIPAHILQDEILYKKYMAQELNLEDDISSEDEMLNDKNNNHTEKSEGAATSLLNLLGALRKSSLQKASRKSQEAYQECTGAKSFEGRKVKSSLDLSQIPGTCQNLRKVFDMDSGISGRQSSVSAQHEAELEGLVINNIERRHQLEEAFKFSSGLKSAAHSSTNQTSKALVQKMKATLSREEEKKCNIMNQYFASEVNGKLSESSKMNFLAPKMNDEKDSKWMFRWENVPKSKSFSSIKRALQDHSWTKPDKDEQGYPPEHMPVSELRNMLLHSDQSNLPRVKEYQVTGAIGKEEIRRRSCHLLQGEPHSNEERQLRLVELEALKTARRDTFDTPQISSTANKDKERIESELAALRLSRQRGKFLSEGEDDFIQEKTHLSERQRVQYELEALRQARQQTSCISRISRGDPSRKSLSRTRSFAALGGESSLDLEPETLNDLNVSNRAVRAMFEASAPKYKFGGSGDKLNLAKEAPKMDKRAQAMPKNGNEERKWVMDTINKYFDVIVEENEEDQIDDSGSSLHTSASEDSSDMNEGIFYPDSDDEEADGPQVQPSYKSTMNIRGMVQQVMNKVSGQANASKEVLVTRFKKNLGSQISLSEHG